MTTSVSDCPRAHFGSTGNDADDDFCTGYADNGDRLVAGIVALNKERTYVLMIESSRRNGWVLPKGGWELDETCEQAAKREAWEEGGINCTIDYDLGKVTETRSAKQISKNAPRALYQFYEATVTSLEDTWPEMAKRGRKWFQYKEAAENLRDRPELAEALRRSTLKR